MTQREHPAAGHGDEVGVVGRHQHRCPAARDPVQKGHHVLRVGGVEARRGLVGEQDRRPRGQGAGDRQPLLLPTRQLPRVRLLTATKSDLVQGHPGPVGGFARRQRQGGDAKRVGDVLDRGQMREQAVVLEDHADVAAEVANRAPRGAVKVLSGDD